MEGCQNSANLKKEAREFIFFFRTLKNTRFSTGLVHTGPEGGESSIAWSSQAEAGHREGGHRAGRTREPRRTSCGGDYEDDLSEGQQEPTAGRQGAGLHASYLVSPAAGSRPRFLTVPSIWLQSAVESGPEGLTGGCIQTGKQTVNLCWSRERGPDKREQPVKTPGGP